MREKRKSVPSRTAAANPPAPTPEAPPSAWQLKFAALGRSRWVFVLLSILLLLPIYWQPRVEAGDLSSHIYNSWLAQLIESGKLQGLVIVSQTTNVLFDFLLNTLFRTVGPELAQRIAVSIAVLTLIWGAFAFVSTAAGRRAWNLLPCIAMLAYGWVFHMGFFDFYLSMGLCFWGLALTWELKPKLVAIAVPVFLLAYTAHALAFAWAIALAAFLWASTKLPERKRTLLTAVSIAMMLLVRVAVSSKLVTRWSPDQFALTTGADQLRVFDDKYYFLFIALLIVWGLFFIDLMRTRGAKAVGLSMPFQFFVLSAAGVFLLPGMVLIPGYRHALVYISERMSLGVGVCVCALLAGARPRAFSQYALAGVAAVFFAFLYRDERVLNILEQRMQNVVEKLPAGQRVVNGLVDDDSMRINTLAHMIDRVCIGRCYSYANYEPSTWQFRIHAVAPNPYVIDDYKDSFALQTGQYVVRDRDLPLYELVGDDAGHLGLISLPAGSRNGARAWKTLPDLL